MSHPAPEPENRSAGRPGVNPRRGRAVVIGTIVGVILAIFAVLLLVTQCGSSSDDVEGSAASAADPVALVGLRV